jgi:hypothetical protein
VPATYVISRSVLPAAITSPPGAAPGQPARGAHGARVLAPLLSTVTMCVSLAACSGGGGSEAGVPSLPSVNGRVRVEVVRDSRSGTEVGVTARFLRYRDVDRATAELLAGGEPVLADGCQPPAAAPALDDLLALLPDAARVEHLDAGEVSVVYDGVAVTTTPTRAAPLSPWVDGVEYDQQTVHVARESRLADGGRVDEVVIAGFGGQHVGAFDAAVALPEGRAIATVEPDLVVTWPASADEVVVTVDGATGPVCRSADRGGVRIPAALLPADSQLTVSVDRVRRIPLVAPGLGASGELEVVVRDVLSVWRP